MKLTVKKLWPMNRSEGDEPATIANRTDKNVDAKKTNTNVVWRDIMSFWILGFCTEIGYILMLCAAHDILHSFQINDGPIQSVNDTAPKAKANSTFMQARDKSELEEHYEEICAASSAGILLIADIVPAMIMSVICPFLPLVKNFRMALAMTLSAASFIVIAYAETESMAIVGVLMTSLALGIGEVTLLSYSAKFSKQVIPAWSSGTGAACILGSISYAALTTFADMLPRDAIKLMLVIPILEAIAFWVLLRTPPEKAEAISVPEITVAAPIDCTKCPSTAAIDENFKGLKVKLRSMPVLLAYIAPLVIVFIFEYTCVSGLFEMIFVHDRWLDFSDGSQYRWFMVTYQVGVFSARTFGSLLPAWNTWWAPVAQMLNTAFFVYSVAEPSSANIFMVFAFVFWLGVVGGTCYVHSFLRVVDKIPSAQHKFSFGMFTIAESFGISIGGVVAISIHDTVCRNFV